jgi:hypothetical protein
MLDDRGRSILSGRDYWPEARGVVLDEALRRKKILPI